MATLIARSLLTSLLLVPVASQAVALTAQLQPLNPDVSPAGLSGEVEVMRQGDQLMLHVMVEGAPAQMMHLQHFHGFTDGQPASCPPADADKNGDGYVDLIETEPYSGKTLIPLHDTPTSLEIKTDRYPQADANGIYHYQQSVAWPELTKAVADQYGIQNLDLGSLVVYVHGVPETTQLPNSVQSLPGVPAHVTLPIGCAELRGDAAQAPSH